MERHDKYIGSVE